MSNYLVDRLKRSPRIDLMTDTEVVAVHGSATVESVTVADRRDGSRREVPATAVFVMIGADPCTEAITGILPVDSAGYILCGPGAASYDGHMRWPVSDREPHLLETTRPGVSRPATSAPAPPTAWQARSATERWSSGSYTTYSPPDSQG